MNLPDVIVSVEGGVADVTVHKPGLIVEIRDYDVDEIDDDNELLWIDANGDRCVRYVLSADETQPSAVQPLPN